MATEECIDQVRRFERFYEDHLRKAHRVAVSEDFTAADVRVIHEMGFVEGGASGAWIADQLDLDAAYLSRIFRKLEAHGYVAARESRVDGRMKDWELTDAGREFAAEIEGDYRDRTRFSLAALTLDKERDLVAALRLIERMLRYDLLKWHF